MKLRVRIPKHLHSSANTWHATSIQPPYLDWVDEILLWGMEIDADIAYYNHWNEPGENQRNWKPYKDCWAIFIVEEDMAFMFALKWSALQHKKRVKRKDPTKERATCYE